MLTRPFLTELDSRAEVKGSVDPLGIQAVWTHFGRFVVGNLTTVSSSAMDFTVLLVGYYLSERVAEAGGPSEVETFLKWEQLAAYSRSHVLGQRGFRGTTRTRKNLDEGHRVTLSADQAQQILGNQKTYGIFGLYSNPARASDWLHPERPQLSPLARDLVENVILSPLAEVGGRDAGRLVQRLMSESVRIDLKKRDLPLLRGVAEVLQQYAHPAAQQLFRRHLLFGGPKDPTGGRQRELAAAFEPTFEDEQWELNPMQMARLSERAKASGHVELAAKLDAIRTCESVMAPLAACFSFVVQRDNATLDSVAGELRAAWGERMPTVDALGIERLEGEIREASGDGAAGRFVHAARCLSRGDYVGLLSVMLQQNTWVMETRGGSPWVEDRKGVLRVRLRYDAGRLPAREDLPHLWRHAYFLDSVRSIGQAVGVA